MKLSEYILNEYKASSSALSVEDLDRWIEGWYSIKYGRLPPIWLTGKDKDD
jgi:hypothetical protein|tara:strand:+ start:166 stop:318 length:153 start_codon:yes stop_codon:yes gene_type:complete